LGKRGEHSAPPLGGPPSRKKKGLHHDDTEEVGQGGVFLGAVRSIGRGMGERKIPKPREREREKSAGKEKDEIRKN